MPANACRVSLFAAATLLVATGLHARPACAQIGEAAPAYAGRPLSAWQALLAQHLGVPSTVVNKAPSADLWEGQTDEDELGFTYDEVDGLLYLLVERGYHPEACIKAGFAREFVERVVRRVRQNHFKRVMPPIAWLSAGKEGYDLSSLWDWGRN